MAYTPYPVFNATNANAQTGLPLGPNNGNPGTANNTSFRQGPRPVHQPGTSMVPVSGQSIGSQNKPLPMPVMSGDITTVTDEMGRRRNIPSRFGGGQQMVPGQSPDDYQNWFRQHYIQNNRQAGGGNGFGSYSPMPQWFQNYNNMYSGQSPYLGRYTPPMLVGSGQNPYNWTNSGGYGYNLPNSYGPYPQFNMFGQGGMFSPYGNFGYGNTGYGMGAYGGGWW